MKSYILGHESPVVPAVEVPLVESQVLGAQRQLLVPVRGGHGQEAPAAVVPRPVRLGVRHQARLAQVELHPQQRVLPFGSETDTMPDNKDDRKLEVIFNKRA